MAWSMGLLGAAGSGGVAGPAYDLLETTVLSGNQSSVTFDNLVSTYGSDYKHLELRLVTKSNNTDGSALFANGRITLNGDTGTNYSSHGLTGNGSVVSSSGGGSADHIIDFAVSGNSSGSHYTGTVVSLLDPFDTSKNTTARSLSGRLLSNIIQFKSGAYFNTSAVDSIEVRLAQAVSYVSGSRFSLYGIKAA